MKNHFVIITGYPNKKNKLNHLLNLSNKIREKFKDSVDLCYCTHYPKISEEIYEIFDYVVYNKNNPILNWDQIDNFTKTFGCQVDVGENQSILFYQPYHGFAHHLSICDGIMMGVNTGHDKFTLMNYDCVDFCVDELSIHIENINSDNYDCIFYPFAMHEETDLNTEFFTFNMKLAVKLCQLRDYKAFSNNEYMMYEKIVTKIVDDNDFRLEKRNFNTPNKALGVISYADDTTGDILNDKFYAPFYEKWIDGQRYCYYFFPILNDGKKFIFFIDETQGKFNCTAKINGNVIPYRKGILYELKSQKFDLEIFDDDKRVVYLNINDDRQYAVFKNKINPTDLKKA